MSTGCVGNNKNNKRIGSEGILRRNIDQLNRMRLLIGIYLAVLFTAVFCGCGKPEKSDPAENTPKKLVLGILEEDTRIIQKAGEFEKASGKYQVEIKIYQKAPDGSTLPRSEGVTRLSLDLISGEAPDLLFVKDLDVETYMEKGILEDLSPFLAKSKVLSKEDFFEKILESCTYEGKLAFLPTHFSLDTQAAKTSLVGSRRGWSMEELMDFSRKHPGVNLMESGDKQQILARMLAMNWKRFLDEEKGTCDFLSKDFQNLLLFAKTFPDNWQDMDSRMIHLRLADNSLLLKNVYLIDFDEIQNSTALFCGEDVTFVGYPTYLKSNGCLLWMTCGMAITTGAANREGAWDFIEFMLSDRWDQCEGTISGFSVRKSIYEMQKKQAMEGKTGYDAQGNLRLMSRWGDTWMVDEKTGEEFYYESHPVTKEEADLVEELLSGAVLASLRYDEKLLNIVAQEAGSYFFGDRTVQEAAERIQTRISLYLMENKD